MEEDDEETDFMSWVLGDEAEEEKGAAAKVKRKAAPSKREEEDVAKAGRTKKKKKRAPMELEEGDIKLNCRDCKQAFAFTKGQQDFYAEKGFTNQPSRCKPCNGAKKALERGVEAARQAKPGLAKVRLMKEGDLIREPEARMLTKYGGSEIQYIQ